MSSWMKDNAPLLHLHVKYTTTSAEHLRSIQIRFYNNIEYLGFSLYGNPEILYSIEIFQLSLTYLKTIYESISTEVVQATMYLRVQSNVRSKRFVGMST